jgi:hypothetical protein
MRSVQWEVAVTQANRALSKRSHEEEQTDGSASRPYHGLSAASVSPKRIRGKLCGEKNLALAAQCDDLGFAERVALWHVFTRERRRNHSTTSQAE